MLSVVKFLNSKFYQFLKFRVLPWLESELVRYEDPPGFLVSMVEVVRGQVEKYERRELEA